MSIEARTEPPSSITVSRRYKSANFTHSAASSFSARVLFTIILIFNFPAFTLQLAMDVNTGRWTGSPILQITTLCSALFILYIVFSSRKITSFALHCWPIWIFVSLAFISAVWSHNPAATIHESITYLTTSLLGLAIVGALPQLQCIRTTIRAMVLGCVLSIAWVFIFPEAGVHQQTDVYQSVHAGLWRGIFSHKQGLGYFSGLTTGLLLFYSTAIFPLPMLMVSIACSVACLIGTQSATGIVAAVITPALLYFCYAVMRFPPASRKAPVCVFVIGCIAILAAYKFGLLNFVITHVLGKSTDLTGRADFWPIILENFRNSGSSLLGGGLRGESRGRYVRMECR